MLINSQRIEYKISPLDQRYSRKFQENLAGSEGTFTDLQTPGWSSLMRSQISEKTRRMNTYRQKQSQTFKQSQIYNKLNQAKSLNWSHEHEKKMIRNKQVDKNETKDTDRIRHSSVVVRNNSVKQKERSQICQQKRWNQISVHQYLYKNSKKLQNKKMIQKILDEQIKRKQIFKFTPTINKKSIILAQSKFSRVKQINAQEKKEQSLKTQATSFRSKQDKDVERYRIINKTFYLLSQGKSILGENQLQSSLIKIPIPCIKVIQPIIAKIYQGQKLQWLDFLQSFNSKNITGKEGFYTIMSKWFARNQSQHISPQTQC